MSPNKLHCPVTSLPARCLLIAAFIATAAAATAAATLAAAAERVVINAILAWAVLNLGEIVFLFLHAQIDCLCADCHNCSHREGLVKVKSHDLQPIHTVRSIAGLANQIGKLLTLLAAL